MIIKLWVPCTLESRCETLRN